MERYADSLVAAPIRSSAGRARRASALRPMAVAPSWVIVGPARKLPPWSRLTKPALSSVRRRRKAVLAGSAVCRAHSVRVAASRVQTTESNASARSTALVELTRPGVTPGVTSALRAPDETCVAIDAPNGPCLDREVGRGLFHCAESVSYTHLRA